ncbi:HNH endonuclease [Arthrobacter sp. SDTb3-6]|nr:HNH endonuclease [Arthrobacter sp. SDTb3-6]
MCGSDVDLQADHIIEIADGGAPFDADNLQTLCQTHHDEKSKAERARRAIQRRSTRG